MLETLDGLCQVTISGFKGLCCLVYHSIAPIMFKCAMYTGDLINQMSLRLACYMGFKVKRSFEGCLNDSFFQNPILIISLWNDFFFFQKSYS